jgi:outer membrane protein assembly factor BamB
MPGAASWSQFHADSTNQGSRFVNTINSLEPAWSVDVGHVVFSSPVIGVDGTIYVGNLEGELIAVNPDGTEKFRITLGAPMLAAPAVAADGLIYVMTTARFPNAAPPDHKLRGSLAVVNSDGEPLKLRLLPDQGYTTGSPKLFTIDGKTLLALHVRTRPDGTLAHPSAVLVYDADLNLLGRRDVGCGPPVVVTSSGGFFDILDGFLELFQFDKSAEKPPLRQVFGQLDASVAIAPQPGGPPEQPLIVVANRECGTVSAFRWVQPNLVPVWERAAPDDTPLRQSSPAIINEASVVVVARRDARAAAFDLASGTPRFLSDIGEGAVATPASAGELIYVASVHRLHALNRITGAVVHQRELTGQIHGSPAVSRNHVHVQTSTELTTLSLDLANLANDDESPGGSSSPAIGATGAVYVIVQPGDPLLLERDEPARLVSYPAPKPPGPGLPNTPSPGDQPADPQ